MTFLLVGTEEVRSDKVIAFQKALGYNIGNQDLLIEQIRRDLACYRATSRSPPQYGVPFEVSMVILGANGRYAKVKTAWIIDHGATDPRLVTLYIDR